MSRYYESRATDEIKPGKISAELREALKISETDVPIWIYRMRALGYPPGWLKKAIVVNDDIFDSDDTGTRAGGKKRTHDQQEADETQYDHSKLIEYPGFNSPLPPGCNDYHYYVNMPGMLEHQQLEFAKKHMKCPPPPPPKRHKNELVSATSSSAPSDGNSDGADEDLKPETKPKLLSKASPMPKLERPPLENFSEGVTTELLYFENVTNPNGRFNSIKGLLNNMRKSL